MEVDLTNSLLISLQLFIRRSLEQHWPPVWVSGKNTQILLVNVSSTVDRARVLIVIQFS